jgi:hypothetical protein
VTTKEGGSCTSDSLAAPDRPDVWDCIGENNQIYDPCFEDPYAAPDEPAELACMATPFTIEVVLLTLDEPLQREKEAPAAQGPYAAWDLPWGLKLANGDRCLLLQSDETVLAGETVYYDCGAEGTILGAVDRSRPVWVVNHLAKDAVSSGLTDVTIAWS